MAVAAHLLLGVVAVLASSWLFTNALEWLGERLEVAQGALGSIFAAAGTALPEASIAVLAALMRGRGAGVGQAVSIGAVLGAPLLLGTVGFAILGVGTLRARRQEVHVPWRGVRRDLACFLGTFGSAALVGALGAPPAIRLLVAVALLLGYAAFVLATLAVTAPARRQHRPRPLLLAGRRGTAPPTVAIVGQLVLALAAMLLGGELFVHTLTGLAARVQLSGFVLAVLVAPLATELPETMNGLVWVARDRDALAAGNVTGALVLQGAVIPALGMIFTPWRFEPAETVAALVALGGAATVLVAVWSQRSLRTWALLLPGLLYVAFVLWVL